MRYLTLIRHGKSQWNIPELQDFERPLNARGWRDVPLMARRFAGYVDSPDSAAQKPDRLLSSYATRALTTARLFAQALAIPVEQLQLSEALFQNTEQALWGELRSRDDSEKWLCLFGHNPGFTTLANSLCADSADGLDNLPTAGVIHFTLPVAHWRDIRPGCGRVAWLSYPKKPAAASG